MASVSTAVLGVGPAYGTVIPNPKDNSVPYQPINPARGNVPNLQTFTNYQNANDFDQTPVYGIDRYVQRGTLVPLLDLRDYKYTTLEPNKNIYQPRKYPDPYAQQTRFYVRKRRPVPMNGSVCAYNPVNAVQMPATGTNDTAFIMSVGL